ncbi:hypothetical protein AB5I41_11560 [Sphingomonas sp. MMS24-JH45]
MLALARRWIDLVVTEHNVSELLDVLVKRFGMTIEAARDVADFTLARSI